MAGIGEIDWGRIYAFLYKPGNDHLLDDFAHNPAEIVKKVAADPELNIQLPPDGTLFEMLPTDLSEEQLKDMLAGGPTKFEVFMRLCC